jgi:hypothetical protein
MALSQSDKDVLEEIVQTDGQCMESNRCKKCPFRSICLPDFLNINPPTQPQRLKMAQDVLTHHYLLDEDMEQDAVNQEFNQREEK